MVKIRNKNKHEDSYVQKSLLDYEQLYGNLFNNDLYGAVALVREFGIKSLQQLSNTNSCGVAIGNTGYDSI
ncbi:MAG: hypothetical protein ACLRHD_07585 [Thomasclavelia spiroformis]